MECLGRDKDSSSRVQGHLQPPRAKAGPILICKPSEAPALSRGMGGGGSSRPTATAKIVQKRGCKPPVEGPGLILEFVWSCGEQLRHLVWGQRRR